MPLVAPQFLVSSSVREALPAVLSWPPGPSCSSPHSSLDSAAIRPSLYLSTAFLLRGITLAVVSSQATLVFFEVSIKLLGKQQARSYTVLRRSLCPERQGDMPCYVALKERSPFHTSKAGPREPALPHAGTEASPVCIRCRTGRMAIPLLPRQGTQRPQPHYHTHILQTAYIHYP